MTAAVPGILLAIETSQRCGGVAVRGLADGHDLDDVEVLRSTRRHEDDLLPAIKRLLDRHELSPTDLRAIGVSLGPGGFTGLRIAVSTAKMLAETLSLDVLAVPSAEVIAENYERQSGNVDPILVVLAVKGESFWTARMQRRENGGWRQENPGVRDSKSLPLTGIRAVIADEHLPDDARLKAGDADIPVYEPEFDPRGAAIAAFARWSRGEKENPLSLQPIYPRPPEAVTLWQAAQRRRSVQ